MLGAIAGDIIGSVYEFYQIKTKNFPLFIDDSSFTDDTILTVAVAPPWQHDAASTHSRREWHPRPWPESPHAQIALGHPDWHTPNTLRPGSADAPASREVHGAHRSCTNEHQGH